MNNHRLALFAAMIGAVINFAMYGNLLAAVFGAGVVTYVLGRIWCWVHDAVVDYIENRKKK